MSVKELRRLEESLENQRKLIRQDKSASISLLMELGILRIVTSEEKSRVRRMVTAR